MAGSPVGRRPFDAGTVCGPRLAIETVAIRSLLFLAYAWPSVETQDMVRRITGDTSFSSSRAPRHLPHALSLPEEDKVSALYRNRWDPVCGLAKNSMPPPPSSRRQASGKYLACGPLRETSEGHAQSIAVRSSDRSLPEEGKRVRGSIHPRLYCIAAKWLQGPWLTVPILLGECIVHG